MVSSCRESQVCAAFRDHGSHWCVLAGSCLQVSDNDDAEQEVEVWHRQVLLTVFERKQLGGYDLCLVQSSWHSTEIPGPNLAVVMQA